MAVFLQHTLPGRAAKGIITYTDRFEGTKLFEGDMRQCVHCQKIWTYKMGSGRLSGFCWRCNGYICDKRACLDCYPAEKRVEDMEHIFQRNKRAIEAAYRRQQWLMSI